MTGLANHALQKAIYATLVADAPLMAKVTGVWDEPEENAAFPIVVIGEGTTVDNSTKTEEGQSHTITLHVWSEAKGKMELKEIMGLLYDALHDAALTLDGHTSILVRFENSDDLREREGERSIYHGVLRFRVFTQAN